MKLFISISALIAVACAYPLDIIEDEDGQQYYAVPISRNKRQTDWGLDQSGFGISHKGNIFENNNHRLDGTVSAAKSWDSHGLRPDQLGGQLDYTHTPSRSGAFLNARNIPDYGTDVNAGVKYSLYHDKKIDIDVKGQYGKHFGGPAGIPDPEGKVLLTGTVNF